MVKSKNSRMDKKLKKEGKGVIKGVEGEKRNDTNTSGRVQERIGKRKIRGQERRNGGTERRDIE